MKKWNNAELVALDLKATENGKCPADFEGLGVVFYGCIPVGVGCFHDATPQQPEEEGRTGDDEQVTPDLHS